MDYKILIIDDEEIVCDGLSRVLEREGYPVDYTTDNESALNLIKEKEYDIILLDINMPVKSGLHLLPEIKAISVDSLIIMVTAYSDTEMAVKSMKAGACDYFVKSSNCDELLNKIKNALKSNV
jgi:DNA-binding NtrC family response regulator